MIILSFQVEITLNGPDSNQIRFTGNVFSFQTPKETIYMSKDCFSVTLKQIEKLKVPEDINDQSIDAQYKLNMQYKLIKK